jgi:hypothetical protein
MAQVRISTNELKEIAALLFDKRRFSGQSIARALEMNANTLWTWFFTRGMPVDEADKVADVITEWAEGLLKTARKLRASAAANRPVASENVTTDATPPARPRRPRSRRRSRSLSATGS